MKRKAFSVFLALVMLTVAAGVFAQQEKVTICHKPGTEDEETLSVAAPALDAHLAHGDYEGECNPPPGCFDRGAAKDFYYNGEANTLWNSWATNSNDGSCTSSIFQYYSLVNAFTLQGASEICESLGLSPGAYSFNGYGFPSTAWICNQALTP